MAEYKIDKIEYSSNVYRLLDNGALHTDGGLLSGTTSSFKSSGTIAAEQGIFNKLVATSADIGTLDVDNLTANNAKVMGLLDVQGEMHTKSWTNANISNIGGSFYISPTVSTTIASNNTPMSITIGGSANNRIFQVTGGNFATDAVKTYSGGSTSTVTWVVGSHVMVTGNIRLGTTGVDYPLGTLTGYLTSPVTSGGPSALVTTGFTVGEINSPALETIISELGTSNLKSYEIKISMFEIGPKTALKPVGIMMTSYGVDKSTYLDIYGGINQKTDGETNPNLRIGYLGGLKPYIDSAGQTRQPVGWGIYTDNGFFKGTIVADSGSISKFKIDTTTDGSAISTGTIGTTNGILISPDNTTSYTINGGTRTNLRLAIGTKFGVDNNGVLYADGANITNINASNITTGSLDAQLITTNKITASQLDATSINVSNMLTIGAVNPDTRDEILNENISVPSKVAELTDSDDYTLKTIFDALDEYVNSHMKLEGNELSILSNSTAAKIVLGLSGLSIYGTNGIVAQYGEDAVIGNPGGFHITITANYNNTNKPRLSFYRDEEHEVAYISEDKLYITQSVVLQQMDVGTKMVNGVGGQWSWKVHAVNNKNNLYLKWLG